jgi:hypothetical protein
LRLGINIELLEDLVAQAAMPSEQMEEMAGQKGRKPSRKTRVCETKSSDKGKSVHKTSERGAKSVMPDKECGDSENVSENVAVSRDQFRLDQLETLLISSTQQNREFRDFMMSSMGVEPMADYQEDYDYGYDYPLTQQDPEVGIFPTQTEAGVIPCGQVAPSAESAAPAGEHVETSVAAIDNAWGFCDEEPKGKPLADDVAANVKCLFTSKMDSKKLTDTAAKYATPSNVECLAVPLVNEVIWNPMSSRLRTQDLRAQQAQKYLLKGVMALLSTVDTISDQQKEAVVLLVAANNDLNTLRRDLIKPELKSNLTTLCKPTNPVTKYLFGDDLTKNIKDLETQQKTTSSVMKSQTGFRRGHPYSRPFGPYSRPFGLASRGGRRPYSVGAFVPRPFQRYQPRLGLQTALRGRGRMRFPARRGFAQQYQSQQFQPRMKAPRMQ